MDSYAPLVEKIRIPQPSLQKLAVISIFDKFRSAPPSDSGKDAISYCLHSTSPAVVDQSTREICRLVKDSKFDISTGLLELQSALEESSNAQLARVFVKAIGLLTRLGFQEQPSSFRFYSPEIHPFVKILSCSVDVQGELLKQIIIFITKCKHLGMEAICEFLGPFLNYSIIMAPSLSCGSTFVRNLISTLAAFCCSFSQEAISIFKLLMGVLKYIPCKNGEDFIDALYIFECLVNAYVVVLRQLVGMGLLVHEAQLCGLAMLEAILSQHRDFYKNLGGVQEVLDLSNRLLVVQKELGLNYVTELSSVMLSFFQILTELELEHEQCSILKLVLLLLQWKSENEYKIGVSAGDLSEELLFIFPVLALVSSPSRPLKQTSTDLLAILGKIASNSLFASKEKQPVDKKHLSIATPGQIVFRLLRTLWFEDQLSFYDSFYSDGEVCPHEEDFAINTWTSSVREYCSGISAKHKSSSSVSKEILPTEISMMLCAVASVLLLHKKRNSAINLLAFGSSIEPKIGVPLFLMVLFYSYIFSSTNKCNYFHDMLLKLLGLLPSVASHPAITTVILQIFLPMLQKEVNSVVKATAIRLIAKTWEINDRVFGSMQGVLHQNTLMEYAAEREICISIAISIEDVCKRNPDRGVDIILSVAACIENHDPLVQSLGLQSLAHLCEADVIDFYTAWDVIGKHTQNYSQNAIFSYGLALLLRWGAMDAEVHPETAKDVLNILWDIGTLNGISQSTLWTRAQEAAFNALLKYEVDQIQRMIPEFSSTNTGFIISQANPDLLTALEEFEVKIMNYEHTTRRRFVKQKKVAVSGSKIVKLLDVVPEVIFSSGNNHTIKELPGAALFWLPTSKDPKNQGISKGLQDVNAKYRDVVVEICTSLDVSRNILLALLSLQSWKPFMQRWIRSFIMVLEGKAHNAAVDKTSKPANEILKVLTSLAEVAIPRSAENIALAVGALCMVLPASAHAVKSTASKFFLNWLTQYEHEHRQWSAAISLGLISSCLHVTDHNQKYKNISTLLEVASISKSTLVKGACGIGLGFSCHDLLTRTDSGANTLSDNETIKIMEIELLGKILRTLVQMSCKLSGSSAEILEKLATSFPLVTDGSSSIGVEFPNENINQMEEDPWGIAGPIIGLGNCLGAVYRAGAHDAVSYLKDLIFSWIPRADVLFSEFIVDDTCKPVSSVAIGACLALPNVVSFCHRVELIDDIELGHLFRDFKEFLSKLLSVEQLDTFHQNLLMASCTGAGNLLSIVLTAGLHTVEVEHILALLALFRKTCSRTNPPFIHLGGMLGVINAMGAGVGAVIQHFPLPSLSTKSDQRELSSIMGSLLANQVLEPQFTSLIQEMFLFAQNSDDPLLQQYAAWAISFLRHFVFSREFLNEEGSVCNDNSAPKSLSQGCADDSLVMKLSTWFVQMNFVEIGACKNIRTAVFVLRCLSHAPRLPLLDWGAAIRRYMKYGGQIAEKPFHDKVLRERTLREECFLFLLSHANQSDSLLGFLDELSDLARFKSLESNLQSLVLLHLADILKMFSSSRVLKLFDDMTRFLHWFISSNHYNQEEKILLRVSCWKGLQICLNDTALETEDYAYNLQGYMAVLFTMLPWPLPVVTEKVDQKNSKLEWSEAIRCLGKAQEGWLSDLLLVSEANFKESSQIFEVLKRVFAKAVLVRINSIPMLDLARLKGYILDINSEVVWNVLVEVVVTLQHSDESVKKQWFISTTEILCVTSYPSTALRFFSLLCGSCCKYLPVLVADKWSVLSDLPVALSSSPIVTGTGWRIVAEFVASYLCKAMERIQKWVRHVPGAQPPIDTSENEILGFLVQVMHQCCVHLKHYLPLEKQLMLAANDLGTHLTWTV